MLDTCPQNVVVLENQSDTDVAVRYLTAKADAMQRYVDMYVPYGSARYSEYHSEIESIRDMAYFRELFK